MVRCEVSLPCESKRRHLLQSRDRCRPPSTRTISLRSNSGITGKNRTKLSLKTTFYSRTQPPTNRLGNSFPRSLDRSPKKRPCIVTAQNDGAHRHSCRRAHHRLANRSEANIAGNDSAACTGFTNPIGFPRFSEKPHQIILTRRLRLC